MRPIHSAKKAIALSVTAVTAAIALASSGQPISIQPIEVETPIGEARGWAATVDLASPKIEVLVTEANDDPAHESVRVSTKAWAERVDATLAINANFYAAQGEHANIVGLSVSDGVVVSPARSHAGLGDPALVFDRDGRARVIRCAPCDDAWDAVSGVGGSASANAHGGLLLQDGVNHGAQARVASGARHPRTAAGVSPDGLTLFLVVVDGRQPGWSVGLTLSELADLMRELGADDALNLDGGGSSSLLSRVSGDGSLHASFVVRNRPSEGAFRPVANHLGIRVCGGHESARVERPSDRGVD
ncbi:MAG: phosphodiester glycosidase family protein [Planctomycetota bacterium]